MRTTFAIVRGMILELVRKKDFYVLMIFMVVLLVLFAGQSFFDLEGIARYIRDFGYTLAMLFSFIIAVIFSARQVPAEIESRTVYPLLAKPLSRFMFVFSKFCGGVVVAVFSFILYFGVFALFCLGELESLNAVVLLQGFLFGVLFLSLACAMVIFFSMFMTMSANVTISFLLYFFMINFPDFLRKGALSAKGAVSTLLGAIYYLLPHFEFFDLRIRITHAWDPLDMWVVGAVTVYTAAYCLIFLYFAGAMFRRKNL